ncbi:hypothetical protein L9F63_006835, partial [Diploptera punctata]
LPVKVIKQDKKHAQIDHDTCFALEQDIIRMIASKINLGMFLVLFLLLLLPLYLRK